MAFDMTMRWTEPEPGEDGDRYPYFFPNWTAREHLAAMAMQGLLAALDAPTDAHEFSKEYWGYLARDAFGAADALIAAAGEGDQ